MNYETSADRIPASPHPASPIQTPKFDKIPSNGHENVSYSFAGKSSDHTANF